MIDDQTRNRLSDNWGNVKSEVCEAADKCGRDPDSVTIIGVSKYVDVELTQALFDCGCTNLGESRPQVLWQKAVQFSDRPAASWHLIGHLQRNKIRRTIPLSSLLVHSVDSNRTLDAIAQESIRQSLTTSVLLEVNISGDDSKTGMTPESLRQIVGQLPVGGVNTAGLMAMAGWGTDPNVARKQFDQLRQLRDDIVKEFDVQLAELSMGMSGDFAEAIAAGATMVRIGSRLFEGIR